MKRLIDVNTHTVDFGILNTAGDRIMSSTLRHKYHLGDMCVTKLTDSATSKTEVVLYDLEGVKIFRATDVAGDEDLYSNYYNGSLVAYASVAAIISALTTIIDSN